jgi:hypothetical protein
LQARNALLRDRTFHFSDVALHETLETNMDPDLELRVRRLASTDLKINEWIEVARQEDGVVTRERQKAEVVARMTTKATLRAEQYGGRNPAPPGGLLERWRIALQPYGLLQTQSCRS